MHNLYQYAQFMYRQGQTSQCIIDFTRVQFIDFTRVQFQASNYRLQSLCAKSAAVIKHNPVIRIAHG